MWKLFKFTASSSNLSLLGPSWLTGWNVVGNHQFTKTATQQLPLTRHEQDGWVDFFIGDTQPCHAPYRSLLDGQAKVGLHYRNADLYDISKMARPSADIPSYLWQSLQEQYRL